MERLHIVCPWDEQRVHFCRSFFFFWIFFEKLKISIHSLLCTSYHASRGQRVSLFMVFLTSTQRNHRYPIVISHRSQAVWWYALRMDCRTLCFANVFVFWFQIRSCRWVKSKPSYCLRQSTIVPPISEIKGSLINLLGTKIKTYRWIGRSHSNCNDHIRIRIHPASSIWHPNRPCRLPFRHYAPWCWIGDRPRSQSLVGRLDNACNAHRLVRYFRWIV